jgi:hypothetical protein
MLSIEKTFVFVKDARSETHASSGRLRAHPAEWVTTDLTLGRSRD